MKTKNLTNPKLRKKSLYYKKIKSEANNNSHRLDIKYVNNIKSVAT